MNHGRSSITLMNCKLVKLMKYTGNTTTSFVTANITITIYSIILRSLC